MTKSRVDQFTPIGMPRIPRLLTLFAAGLFSLSILAGCENSAPTAPLQDEDLEAAEEGPLWGDPGVSTEPALRTEPASAAKTADRNHWADGYVWANSSTSASYTPSATYSYNRTGGAISITRVPGTVGKYRVRFANLNHFLGKTHTVKVTAYGTENAYCKPKALRLKGDVVEVWCFNVVTGAAMNSRYTVLITRNYTDVAYAHANKPTSTNYAPPANGAWNPSAGLIRILRDGVGRYRVVFFGLGSYLPGTGSGRLGHVQVVAVGRVKDFCTVQGWGGSPNLTVSLRCFNENGLLRDTKFNALFFAPSSPLGYAWAHNSTSASYTPSALYAYNSAGGAIQITRQGVGSYTVSWSGLGAPLIGGGDVQVTAYGTLPYHCKVLSWGSQSARVRCQRTNGLLVDSRFDVLLGS